MSDKPLTPAQVEILRAAARGDLYREACKTEIRNGWHRVTAVAERVLARHPKLLREGYSGEHPSIYRRPLLLTEAGHAELAKHPERKADTP